MIIAPVIGDAKRVLNEFQENGCYSSKRDALISPLGFCVGASREGKAARGNAGRNKKD